MEGRKGKREEGRIKRRERDLARLQSRKNEAKNLGVWDLRI